MNYFICETCGVQYDKSKGTPKQCTICSEERQYVNPAGQSWTTLEKMEKYYKNNFVLEEPGLHSLQTSPSFGIGQTAYLVQSNRFNVLWDCLSFIDEKTINEINSLGGLNAIALSHPHYYSSQVVWAEKFDVPIYIHEDDKEWVMRPSDQIFFWSGESLTLSGDMTVHRLGGHFKGASILEWNSGNDEKGVLLTGDVIQVAADRKWVSFMYSYPNLIPLPASAVQKIAAKLKNVKFNRLYNAFHRVVIEDAHGSVQKSAERYIKALEGTLFDT
jgi:glyoxylase-like metal-dependent hydrolase (beta-lactamase superfamily II)/rubredoxin